MHPASIEDPTACDRFVLREVRGIDPAAPTPLRMRVRLARAGMRSVSLAVDITNYLMLELGQPLHAFDADKLNGPSWCAGPGPGSGWRTLDHVLRDLDPEDIVITDASGPISLAGTMGGLATEISGSSANLVIEAAHFDAARGGPDEPPAQAVQRGVLPLRARGGPGAAAARLGPGRGPAGRLGGGTVVPGCTHAQVDVPAVSITMAADYPDRGGRAWCTARTP